MLEQEKFKMMLTKVIHETENQHIQSSQEMVQAIIDELTHDRLLPNVHPSVVKSK